jgi:predicted transglutaminase-like cysteine proteinase
MSADRLGAGVRLPWSKWRHAIVVCAVAVTLLPAALPVAAWDAEAMLRAAQPLGPRAVAGARQLQVLLAETAAEGSDERRLDTVNRYFNERVAFATDLEVWGQEDYWATPLETLSKGRGDCEDYVIAKYFSLLAAGVLPERLRLVYVRAMVAAPGRPAVSLAHMVLAYSARPGDDALILDNLRADIRPASQRPDLSPVFSFNAVGLWQGADGPTAGDPVARLSRWRELLEKVRGEGFR